MELGIESQNPKPQFWSNGYVQWLGKETQIAFRNAPWFSTCLFADPTIPDPDPDPGMGDVGHKRNIVLVLAFLVD